MTFRLQLGILKTVIQPRCICSTICLNISCCLCVLSPPSLCLSSSSALYMILEGPRWVECRLTLSDSFPVPVLSISPSLWWNLTPWESPDLCFPSHAHLFRCFSHLVLLKKGNTILVCFSFSSPCCSWLNIWVSPFLVIGWVGDPDSSQLGCFFFPA